MTPIINGCNLLKEMLKANWMFVHVTLLMNKLMMSIRAHWAHSFFHDLKTDF